MLKSNISHGGIRERRNISLPNEDFTVRDTPFSISGVMDILTHLKQGDNKPVFLTDEFSVDFLALSDFIISFSSKKGREDYKDILSGFSLPEDSAYQQPILRGEFEYKDKYYLILGARNNFDAGLSDYKSYKGVIFDIKNFIDLSSQVDDILLSDK